MTKKAIAVGIVGLFVISGLVGMLLIVPGEVEAPGPTYVSGLITENTTWTVANSPYIVVGNMSVDPNVNLTIEPGVIVKFDIDKYLRVNGTLFAVGTQSQIITFTSNKSSPKPGDWGGIRFESDTKECILKYCIIEYGGGKYVDPIIRGGGIYNIGNELKVSFSRIANNSADYGGGIYSSGSIVISHSEISYNSGNGGGGIVNWVGGTMTIDDCKIYNNSIIDGHGGGIFNNGILTMVNSNIFNNSVTHVGGGIYNEDSLIMENCSIINNSADSRGGGIYNDNHAILILNESLISYNSCNIEGGGIFNLNILSIKNSIISANSANYGAGIYTNEGTTNISYSSIIQNYGYGIHGDDSISYCSIMNNTDGGIKGNPINLTYTNLDNPNYNIFLLSSTDVYAPYNWWGTIDTDLINLSIHDYYDDFSLGKVIYMPFQNSPIIEYGSGLQEGAPWPMFHGNVRHTGLSPYDTSGNPGELKWSFKTEGPIYSSAAVDSNSTIYTGAMWDNYFYAIYPNGTLKWKFLFGDYVEMSCPAISSDGTIYVGSNDNYLYAINSNGTLKWKFKTAHYVEGSPTIGYDGTIYVGSEDSYLYAIYPNGTMKWKFWIPSTGYSVPAIDLYIAS